MTAKDFWKAYAEDTTVVSGKSAYQFSHNEESLASGGFVQFSAAYDTYLFHYTRDARPKHRLGGVTETLYRGGVLILKRDDGKQDVGGVRVNDDTKGLYEGIVKDLIDEAAIFQEIANFHNGADPYCYADLNLEENVTPVYRKRIGKFTGTGIWINYSLLVRHDTHAIVDTTVAPSIIPTLVYETSDFSTGNGWTHNSVETFTANADGDADYFSLSGSGQFIQYLFPCEAGSHYLCVADLKDFASNANADLLFVFDNTTIEGEKHEGNPNVRITTDALSEYTRFSISTYSFDDSGTIGVGFTRQGGQNKFYIKNFRIYKLTFLDGS